MPTVCSNILIMEKYVEFLDKYGIRNRCNKNFSYGDEGLNEISSHDDVDIVVAAIVSLNV